VFARNNHVIWRVNTVMNVLALGFGNFGGPDVLIILLIVLIFFGAKKLPDLARVLGQSVNEFRKAREDVDRELQGAGASSASLSSFPTAMSTPFPLPAPGTAPNAGLLKVPAD
jgi:sec-independent protein translocase protein TatA